MGTEHGEAMEGEVLVSVVMSEKVWREEVSSGSWEGNLIYSRNTPKIFEADRTMDDSSEAGEVVDKGSEDEPEAV